MAYVVVLGALGVVGVLGWFLRRCRDLVGEVPGQALVLSLKGLGFMVRWGLVWG
jgi:hypothetical protein